MLVLADEAVEIDEATLRAVPAQAPRLQAAGLVGAFPFNLQKGFGLESAAILASQDQGVSAGRLKSRDQVRLPHPDAGIFAIFLGAFESNRAIGLRMIPLLPKAIRFPGSADLTH
jgi:hypothetical protein